MYTLPRSSKLGLSLAVHSVVENFTHIEWNLFCGSFEFLNIQRSSGSKEENCRRASLKFERERKVGKEASTTVVPGFAFGYFGHGSCAWLFGFVFCVKAIDGGKGSKDRRKENLECFHLKDWGWNVLRISKDLIEVFMSIGFYTCKVIILYCASCNNWVPTDISPSVSDKACFLWRVFVLYLSPSTLHTLRRRKAVASPCHGGLNPEPRERPGGGVSRDDKPHATYARK